MVSRRIKLKPNRAAERDLERTLFQLAGLYNWAVRKLYMDGKGGRFYRRWDFQALIAEHGAKCGLNQHTMQEIVTRAWRAHHRRSNRQRPARMKGQRNRMNAIPVRSTRGSLRWQDRTHIRIPGLGIIKARPDPRFPVGTIKYGLVQRRAGAWYITLMVDAAPDPIPLRPEAESVGIDFGFMTLATLSTGEKIPHPREYQRLERRIGQADRGRNLRLRAKLHLGLANARRFRNHAISRNLLSRFPMLYLSRDDYTSMARRGFGKSVHSAAITHLITMLRDKGRAGGRRVIEVPGRNSTRTCADCGCLTGPTGRAGLKVRVWTCEACGATHDRDVNAAVFTARLGAVLAHEIVREH
ncbi:MAG TPA: transposase [Phycisphaerales bacterium]|nr:transposase [Phycisphaerales bacterium]